MGKAIIHQLAFLERTLAHQRGQIVEQEAQVNVEAPQGLMHDVQPDIALMLGDGIQRPAQAVIVELGSREAQDRYQHRLSQPVRHLIQGAGRGQPVEHQDQYDRPVVHLGGTRTVAVDDLAHIEDFQQAVQDGQGTQIAPQLGSREPIHQCRHGQGTAEQQASPARRPESRAGKPAGPWHSARSAHLRQRPWGCHGNTGCGWRTTMAQADLSPVGKSDGARSVFTAWLRLKVSRTRNQNSQSQPCDQRAFVVKCIWSALG